MKNSKIIKYVSFIDTTIFITVSTALVLLTVYGVFRRYVVNSPLTWLEEIQMILIVQTSFFGGSIAFRERGHIAVDLLVDSFGQNAKTVVEVFVWALVLTALCLLGWQEFLRTMAQIRNGRVSNILKIPMYVNYGGVTLATLLMIIGHIANGIEDFVIKRRVNNDK